MKPVSKCCSAPIIETNGGGEFGVVDEGTTWWSECTKCKQPCDPQTMQKRTKLGKNGQNHRKTCKCNCCRSFANFEEHEHTDDYCGPPRKPAENLVIVCEKCKKITCFCDEYHSGVPHKIAKNKEVLDWKKEFDKKFTNSYAGDSGLGGNDPQEPCYDWACDPQDVKSFIKQLLKDERKKCAEIVEQEVFCCSCCGKSGQKARWEEIRKIVRQATDIDTHSLYES